MQKFTLLLLCFLISTSTFAQYVTVEGYAYETGNRGFLNQVSVTLFEANSKAIKGKSMTDVEGYFSFEVTPGVDYMVRSEKRGFDNREIEFTTKGKAAGEKVFLKMEIARQPGYIFDVTLAERRPAAGIPVDAISDSFIEIYNNTTKKEELVLKHQATPSFNFTFEQGNHYTVMIRKSGFFTKRMEAYVNIEGCILCFDGVGDVRPGVSDVMTEGNTMGTLLANVELDRVELNKTIKVENIYYDLAKWDIREDAMVELDKLVTTLKDNPALLMELGSHTDSRGRDSYNLDLSEKRAQAAVEYLVANGVDANRISAKGYGETVLKNKCANGVKCSERRHQQNRRTELKITGILDDDPYTKPSLKEIIEEEAFQKMLEDVQNGVVIEVEEGEALPEEVIKERLRKMEENKAPKYKMPDLPKTEKETIPVDAPVEQGEEEVFLDEEVEVVIEDASIVETPIVESNPDLGSTITMGNKPVVEKTEIKTPIEQPVVEKPAMEMPATEIPFEEEPPIVEQPAMEIPVPSPMEKPAMEVPATDTPVGGKIFSGKDVESMAKKDMPEIPKDTKMVQDNKVTTFNSPLLKDLPNNYSGYRVQLILANSKLPGSHQIFSQHGDLTLEETKDGTFAYLLGDFIDVTDAEGFLKHIVQPRYPDAKIVQYLDGKRVVK